MKVKKVPVDIYVEYAYCDCGEEMIRDDLLLMSNPPQYKYRCPKCGKLEINNVQYPILRVDDKHNDKRYYL